MRMLGIALTAATLLAACVAGPVGEPVTGADRAAPADEGSSVGSRSGDGDWTPPVDDEVVLPWALRGSTPDGRVLVLDVVPRSCETVDRLTLREDDDRVEVLAVGMPLDGDLACTDRIGALADGRSASGEVRLAAPLGDRQLVGCAPDDRDEPGRSDGDCRAPADRFDGGLALLDDDLAVSIDGEAVVALALDTGDVRWRADLPAWGGGRLRVVPTGILLAGDGLLLLDRRDGAVLGEVAPGEVGPHHPPIGVDPLITRDRGDLAVLRGLDPRTLEERWTTRVAGVDSLSDAIVALPDGGTAVQGDRLDAGISELVLLDADGAEVGRYPLPSGALLGRDGDDLVHAGADGRLRTLDLTAQVRTETDPIPGFAQLAGDGVVVVQQEQTRVAVDLRTGEERFREDRWPPALRVADLDLLVVQRDALTIDGLDPRSGATRWTVTTTGGQDVGGCEADLVLVQAAASLGVRAADGCVGWWVPRDRQAALVVG